MSSLASRQTEARALLGSVATPFAAAETFVVPVGSTLAEIVEHVIAQGLLDRAWLPRVDVLIDEARFAPELWAMTRPRDGRLIAIRARPGWTFLIDLAINV